MCEVKVCEGINELRRFIEEVNRKSYEIIAMTEMMHTYTSCYTILYRTRWNGKLSCVEWTEN